MSIRMPGSVAAYAPGSSTRAGEAEPPPEMVSWSGGGLVGGFLWGWKGEGREGTGDIQQLM